MLLAAIAPRAAITLSLLLTIRATAQDGAAGSEGMAITRDSIKDAILSSWLNDYGARHFLYSKLLNDCINEHNSGIFHSDIKLKPGFNADKDMNNKHMFISLYLLSCEDPEKKINSLISADPSHRRYELLFDCCANVLWSESYCSMWFDNIDMGSEKIKENVKTLKSSISEHLRGRIAEAASMRTIESLGGVFTADTAVDAFLHLRRRGGARGDISYDDLSDVLANALNSGDRKEAIRQFIKPLMNYVIGIQTRNRHHKSRCFQAMREGMRAIDEEEAREIGKEMLDWEKLSPGFLMEGTAKFVEIATDLDFDPRDVTRYIIDFYHKHCYGWCEEGMLSALSAYYLDVLDADGQTRLKKVAEDSSLMNGLPHQLILRLFKDCSKLSVEHPEAAKHLKKCLNSA
ncbi:hypothetical protein PAPHI01_1435 [Pancytospora philotis]|nr:hypothetical protein PAPHI01_1435 [Pancytospora philotis]